MGTALNFSKITYQAWMIDMYPTVTNLKGVTSEVDPNSWTGVSARVLAGPFEQALLPERAG